MLLLRGQTSASRVPTASACLLSRTCTCILQHTFPLGWVSFEVMHASAEVPFFSRASSSVRSACSQHSRSRCFLPWLRTLCAVPWLFLVSRAALTQEHLLSFGQNSVPHVGPSAITTKLLQLGLPLNSGFRRGGAHTLLHAQGVRTTRYEENNAWHSDACQALPNLREFVCFCCPPLAHFNWIFPV